MAKPRSKNDTRALEEIADVLGAIIERDEKRGLPTTGLESSRREIEWAARQGRTTAMPKRQKSVCLRQNGYSEDIAKAKAEYACASAALPDLHAYDCPYCQYWHLSSRNWDGSPFVKGDNGYFSNDASGDAPK